MSFKPDIKWLLFGLTDEQIKGVVIVGWRAGLILLLLWSLGMFEPYGLGGFAQANDVDKKIAAAVDPIKKEMAEQRSILNDVSRQLTDSLAESKASEIRHLVSRRCKETNTEERNRIIKEIDRKQDEYRRLRGERYVISCSEV